MKKHQLLRLTASLYGKPHLISKEGFEVISQYLRSRNEGLMSIDNAGAEEPKKMNSVGRVAVIDVMGPLTYRSTGWEALCGGMSYESLVASVNEALAAGHDTIVLNVDSGGGEAYGCFEAADEMRAAVDAAGAKLYGYIDGTAASAAYGLICVCDEVIANPYARAGSIGVLIALYNDSEQLKQEGIERIFITDGEQKVPFAADGSFREEFLADLQDGVSRLGNEFRNHVAKHTGLSVSDLKDTQARVFDAAKALELGLVNKIMTRSQFVDYVTNKEN